MENKITKQITKMENIIRYITLFLLTTFTILYNLTENNIFITIGLTLSICEIINMIILTCLNSKVRDIFFQELLTKLKKEESK